MKRFLSLLSCVLLVSILCCGVANAVDIRSSDYFRSYDGSISTGSSSGELSLQFSASARSSMKSLGISSIAVYTSGGSRVKTISGSTSSGLLAASTSFHSGTYTITNLTPGQEYYLSLTFVAKDSYGGDSKPFTTNTATAK